MSLKTRLLTAIFLALLISFGIGAGLAVFQARGSVRAEQVAAMMNARQSVVAAMTDMPGGGAAQAGLLRIVRSWDGSRHVQARLLDGQGQVMAASQPAAASPIPAWLLGLIAAPLKPVSLALPHAGPAAAIRLYSEPLNEAAERWGEFRDRITIFALFFGLAALLCGVTAAHGVQPLVILAQAMGRIGRGEAMGALPETGPRETAELARAFNAMTAALQAAQLQNSQLARQILTIAQEERAELARDLHDEVGPLLFAITTFAATIGRQVETRELAPVRGQLDAVQTTVARVQTAVRDMLGRLQDSDQAPVDLEAALGELVKFWQAVRPETRFTLDLSLPADMLPDAVRECLYRAAQEGISNAVRHGAARHVTVDGDCRDGWVVMQISDDGTGGAEKTGLGLAGMRTRAAALGGGVAIDRGTGWRVTVKLPLHGMAEAPA